MEKETLYRFMENPTLTDAASRKELKAVVDDFPYFQAARLLYTRHLHRAQDSLYDEELGKTAVLCADRKKLFYLIHHDEYQPFLSRPEDDSATETDRTRALLDSFLSSLDENAPTETAIADSGLNIVSTDYLSYLDSLGIETAGEQPEGFQLMKHQDIIDNFIEKAESDEIFSSSRALPENKSQNTNILDDKDEFLTETLARIYIKQKKYEQALTIIKRLSLNFPKKSVYFADQIRFLEYLIINEKNKK